MKTKTTITKLSALLVGLNSFSIQAEIIRVNGYYQGVGLGSTELEINEEYSLQFTTIYSQFGYQFSPYFALEGRLGVGLNEELTPLNGDVYTQDPMSGSITSKPVQTEVDSGLQLQTSIFLKANYPISSRAGIFLFAGYARNQLSYNDGYNSFAKEIIGSSTHKILITEKNYDQDGKTYGVGGDFMLNQRWQVNAEYQYFDVAEGDVYALNFSVNYRF